MTTVRAVSAGQVGSGEAWVAWEESPGPWLRPRAIDVGGTKKVGAAVGAAYPEIIVLTHDDHDHIAGFKAFADAAIDHLSELWVPLEWGILAAVARNLGSAADSDLPVDEDQLARLLADASADATEDEEGNERLAQMVTVARSNLRELADDVQFLERFGRSIKRSRQYSWRSTIGSPDEVARRTVKRGAALLLILYRALRANVRVRFFAVDGVDYARMKPWQTEGSPGSLTIANAVMARAPRRWHGPPLASLTFILGLTIQNRRALCPVIWHRGSLLGSALIWSDTAGEWIPSTGFDLAMQVGMHSAPHHGSDNPAHDAAWCEIARSNDAVLVAAGGSPVQRVRDEFQAWNVEKRSCTRCRHPAPRGWATDVVATTDDAGAWSVDPLCAH